MAMLPQEESGTPAHGCGRAARRGGQSAPRARRKRKALSLARPPSRNLFIRLGVECGYKTNRTGAHVSTTNNLLHGHGLGDPACHSRCSLSAESIPRVSALLDPSLLECPLPG